MVTVVERGISIPNSVMVCLNCSRSSPRRMASDEIPSMVTPYRSKIPVCSSSSDRFSPVCPPKFGNSASGRERAMIRSNESTVSGSM